MKGTKKDNPELDKVKWIAREGDTVVVESH
jgi:hypothetical protein